MTLVEPSALIFACTKTGCGQTTAPGSANVAGYGWVRLCPSCQEIVGSWPCVMGQYSRPASDGGVERKLEELMKAMVAVIDYMRFGDGKYIQYAHGTICDALSQQKSESQYWTKR